MRPELENANDATDDAAPEPCGSWRVTRYIEGNEADMQWCSRIAGECPFPGADKSRSSERRCAMEPGTVLRVKWADACIDDALRSMQRYHDAGDEPSTQDAQIAIDALRACGAGEVVR